MAKDVVTGVFEALEVIYNVFVKHRSFGDFTWLKFIDLITN